MPFPTLQAFSDYGGHHIGRIHPTMYVALQRRRGETLMDRLARLDASPKHCLDNEEFIDEINAP